MGVETDFWRWTETNSGMKEWNGEERLTSVSDADFAQLKKKEKRGEKKKLPFEKGNTLGALKERKIWIFYNFICIVFPYSLPTLSSFLPPSHSPSLLPSLSTRFVFLPLSNFSFPLLPLSFFFFSSPDFSPPSHH